MDLSNLDTFFENSKELINVDEIRRQNPVSEIARKYSVDLKRRGHEYVGLCPFHNEKSASFTVNDDKGRFYCFGCGRHGDVIGFVQEIENVEFREAADRLLGDSSSPPQIRVKTAEELEQDRVRNEEAERIEQKKRERAQEDWRNHTPLWNPAAELGVFYLHEVRKIPPPYTEAVGFGHLPYPLNTDLILPALIIARHDPADHDHVAGVQRIFLTEDGQKYPSKAKFSLGKIPGGRSRLIDPFPLTHLLLGEGLETTLSAHRLFGGDDCGAWCFCGGFPKTVALPDTVEEVLLIADADENGGSQQKAEALAGFIRSTGRKALARVPKCAGHDANDVLRGRCHGI